MESNVIFDVAGLIMNGQRMNYSKYYSYIKNMPDPIMPSELPKRKLNLSLIAKYVKENDICFADMTEEERDQLSITESELIEQWDNMVSLSGVKMGCFLMPWL